MKFGINLPHSGPLASVGAIRDIALEAEALGYETLWAHDHISYDSDWYLHRSSGLVEQAESSEPNFYESLLTLTYVAGFTKTIKLGTAILVLPLRDPRVLARQAMTIQAMSGGRLILGVGIGDYHPDFRVMGIPYKQQVGLTEEYINVLQEIFLAGSVTVNGPNVAFKKGSYYPSVIPIPILMGGGIRFNSKTGKDELFLPTLMRTAQWCDGWIPEGPPNLIGQGIHKIKEIGANLGRIDFKPSIIVSLNMYIGEEKEVHEKMGTSLELEMGSLARGLRNSLIGPVYGFHNLLEAYAKAGVESIRIRCYAEDIDSFIRMMAVFSKEIMPNFT